MLTARIKWFVACFVLFLVTLLLFMKPEQVPYYQVTFLKENDNPADSPIQKENWRGLTTEQRSRLSKLGEILYLDAKYPNVTTTKNYTILIWKHGENMDRRHVYGYSDTKVDPFAKCSVNNCHISHSESDLPTADLIVFHLHRTRGVSELPKRILNTKQIWTFLTDESPYHTFLNSDHNTLENYDGLFNWSMTYRMDSDIPVPYGRTLLRENVRKEHDFDEWNNSKRQDVLIAIMGSNCGGRNHRWEYVAALRKHISVDVYGACGSLKCPGHFTKDCPLISKYKFYLAFENSNCKEYITEKLWWNGYKKNAVPIVMGGPRHLYEQLLPPHSYINVEDFALPRDLANYIIYLNNTASELKQYFSWKQHYKVVNEHGYFHSDSFHYCRMCEALNYNNKSMKVYDKLKKFWSRDDCTESN